MTLSFDDVIVDVGAMNKFDKVKFNEDFICC